MDEIQRSLSPLDELSLRPLHSGFERLGPQAGNIIPLMQQVVLEPLIFLLDHVLTNFRQTEPSNKGTEDAKSTGNPEGVLALLHWVVARRINDEREEPCAKERANLAPCRCNSVRQLVCAGGLREMKS